MTDNTAAERQQRFRDRKRLGYVPVQVDVPADRVDEIIAIAERMRLDAIPASPD
jgi:hypothetical protein